MINFRKYTNATEVVIPEKVKFTNSVSMCNNMRNLVSANVSSASVTTLERSFYNCRNLRTPSVCGDNVTNMSNTYTMCISLTTAVCGPNVTNMAGAYSSCWKNLTTAVCGPNVTNMHYAYSGCDNLTTAICGDKVTNMSNAYMSCYNLTTPVCGPNVTDMSGAYSSCTNLTTAVCGPNVISMGRTYNYCTNIQGNAYFYSNVISNVGSCFYGRSTANRLNIYVHAGTTTNTKVMNTSSYYSLTGTFITWTTDTANNCSYNTTQNIYIYHVANVEEARLANGD